jgi:molybdate transport system substrate-binding protein
MRTRLLNCLAVGLVALLALLALSRDARAEITVMISGGFALAYQELLPEFERTTGIKVVTTSGASQGTGPTTIKARLERGARPDVLILSKEGLEELIAANRIVDLRPAAP